MPFVKGKKGVNPFAKGAPKAGAKVTVVKGKGKDSSKGKPMKKGEKC